MAKDTVVGIDIGSSSIKAVELKSTKMGFQLVNLAVEPLPPETIVDDSIMNAPAVVTALKKLVSTHQIKNKNVASSISGHPVIIRKITLPRIPPEEVERNIQWEAEQYIPFDVKEVNLDYYILESLGEVQSDTMDVLLVAAKKDAINDYASIFEEAGLNLVIMDVDAFALQTMYEWNYGTPGPDEIVALINIGASVINMNIIRGPNSMFTRDVAMGGNTYTEEIQKQLNLSFEEAEAIKLGQKTDMINSDELQEMFNRVSETVAAEIRRSFDFFISTSPIGRIDRVFLSGGCAKIPNLSKIIEDSVGVRVELSNPFARIEVPTKKFDPAYVEEMKLLVGIAVGLAMRRVGDK